MISSQVNNKIISSTLVCTASIVLVSNLIGQQIAVLVGNFIYFPVVGFLVAISIIMLMKYQISGKHGLAWLFFTCFASSWFIAEIIWSVLELQYNVDPFPSLADFFYIGGYPFLFLFSLLYLKPVSSSISRKMIYGAIGISSTLLIPSILISLQEFQNSDYIEFLIGLSYPLVDSVVFVPAILGIIIFFKGRVNFLWVTIMIGITLTAIGDNMFLLEELNNNYYTGSPLEIMFIWAYLFMIFGVYNQYKEFVKKNNIEESRKAH